MGYGIRFATAGLVMALLAGAYPQSAPAGGRPAGSGDGIYTREQAAEGRRVYLVHCATACHMSDLKGMGASPALVGSEFMMRWEGMPLAALWERMATTMPAADPGSLPSEDYLAILAFLLDQNRMPPGPRRLSLEPGDLDSIIIESGEP